MKIAQVNSYYYPFMIGGAEWYVRNVSTELVKAGHEVTVFTADSYGKETMPEEETFEGVKIRRVPLKLDLTYRLKRWDHLKEALGWDDFDVVHTYDYAQPHSLESLRSASERGTGSALTVFDVHSAIPRVWYKRAAMKYIDSYYARRTFPLADRILVRAESLIAELPEMDGCRSKVKVSPSGVRDEAFDRFDGDRFRTEYSIEGSPLVLFMGRLNPLKGPQHLLDAATSLVKEFPDISFAFVGPDQSGYRGVLEAKAKSLGLDSKVTFTGMISDFQKKMEAYSSCDVFVLPTSYEGTSQSIFEAMSQGKPVVSTRTGGIPSQVEDGVQGYLVDYGDTAALASKVAAVLRDKDMAEQMSRSCRSKADRFRYSRLVEALEEDYEEIIRTHGS